jgi:hypothetical protein
LGRTGGDRFVVGELVDQPLSELIELWTTGLVKSA